MTMCNGGTSAEDKARQLQWVKAFSYFIGAVAVVLSVVGVIVAACAGQYALAALFVGLTLFWSIPFGQKLFVKRLVPRARVDSTGVTLRPGRSVDVLGAVMMLIGVATGAGWATLGLLGDVTWPYGDMRFGFLVFAAFAAFCASYLVTMVKNSGTAYVRLTPDGCVLTEGFFTTRASWAEIIGVTDDVPEYTMGRSVFKTKKAQPYAWCAIALLKADGTMATVPNGNLYAPNGDALRELIRFYWQHPEHRQELTDARALERLGTSEPTAP